jgi:hypothetical protein
VLHFGIKIFRVWEEYGKQAVEEFLMEVEINDINLPKTNKEFTLISMKAPKNCPMNLERPHILKNDTFIESMKDLMKNFGIEPVGTGTMREPVVSNFIPNLKGDEITLFETLRIVFEKFKKSPVSCIPNRWF